MYIALILHHHFKLRAYPRYRTIACVSAFANDCPAQFCLPSEKGLNASNISLVGFSQRIGMNLFGIRKISISRLRKRSMKGQKHSDPLGMSSLFGVAVSLPVFRNESGAATGWRRIPSLIAILRFSEVFHSSGIGLSVPPVADFDPKDYVPTRDTRYAVVASAANKNSANLATLTSSLGKNLLIKPAEPSSRTTFHN